MRRKRVLISPLNWGLGHATRCIPLIKIFLENNWDVVIGAEKKSYTLLQKEFPNLEIIQLPGVKVNYSKKLPFVFKILLQAPKILFYIYLEHVRLRKIIDEYNIDLVVSDNRYGLWSRKIPAIFVTHQVNIMPPDAMKIIAPLILKLNIFFIRRFSFLWIPDFRESLNLSGGLSHPAPKINTTYIGPLSRFRSAAHKPEYNYCVVISGPEPQRSLFENKVLESLSAIKEKGVIVRGLPGESDMPYYKGNTRIFNHLSTSELQNILLQSKTVICRSGYSSIMDLITLKRSAVFVPTPGQTEQEYLARHLDGDSFTWMKQKEFSLPKAIEAGSQLKKPEDYPGIKTTERIRESLRKLNIDLS